MLGEIVVRPGIYGEDPGVEGAAIPGGHLQLVVSGEGYSYCPTLLPARPGPLGKGVSAAGVWKGSNNLTARGRTAKNRFPSEASCRRLRFILQALDGSPCGCSHREIAEVLLRELRSQVDRTYILAIIWETHSPPPGAATRP
ncbi:DNA -binding domain-containing protein [Mesorhizobium sp. NZP2298]|uniref:DNA -binding domain-containing protein n=1 Tax=Mesorhizobium sp. NZP2298 TaxID=2483403 RepID=UPI0015576FB3|nr:DUF2285 domain-containing protein [Mesorhizobium sp. NZP2298]